jgi:hypothetical protein
MDSYLDELECPNINVMDNNDEANPKGVMPWRQDPSLRMRVVHWIISCAAFELPAEKLDPKQQQVVVVPSTTTSTTTMEMTSSKKPVLLPKLDPSVFPLGFTTGDDQVNHILILLRMNLLHQIDQEQQQYNQLLADSILLETSGSSRSSSSRHRDKELKTMATKKLGREREGR